jgi:endonuclease/exonuclease/phosphatase family metal-dependent hydrolase
MRLRVLAYNLYFGGADRVDAIERVLSQVDADIVGLTEADDEGVVQTLAGRLQMDHRWARGSGDRHIATLSRFPIRDWAIHHRPPLSQAALETTVILPGPAALGRGQGANSLSIYNVHLLPYLLLPFEIRRWQAVGRLLQVIRARQPGPHLILGDLNAIAPGDRVLQHKNPPRMRRPMMLQLGYIFRLAMPRLLEAGYTDCFRKLNPRADGFTWMPGNLTTRYDYVLADPAMAGRLCDCRVVDDIQAVNQASDHLPLLAEFETGSQ